MGLINRWKIRLLWRRAKKFQQMRDAGVSSQPEVEANIYYLLARRYRRESHPIPMNYFRMREAFRYAGQLGHVQSQYEFAKNTIDEGKFWAEYAEDANPGALPIHRHFTAETFEHAMQFLKMAVEHRHVDAMQLLGLCHVHGWGVPANKQAGFRLIKESIDEANAWGNVNKVISKLRLNSKEFFAAMPDLKN